jgi:DNA-directed RNA polymerase subunit RPC12/RpoP
MTFYDRIIHRAMIVFNCHVCRTALSVEAEQAGTLVRCPTCLTTLTAPLSVGATHSMPAPAAPGHTAGMPGLGRSTGRRYGFNCGYCSSRLEATDAMAAQEGQCPTCGNNITIPILDRYGRLIDPKTQKIIKPDPHPVHAYAAAGERAPNIVRQDDGSQQIRCSRCFAPSPISANNCRQCGMPFTMEGTTLEAQGSSNGYAVAALVLGIIGLPAGITIILPLLAVIFGIVGLRQLGPSSAEPSTSSRAMAIAGLVCGSIGLMLGIWLIAKM